MTWGIDSNDPIHCPFGFKCFIPCSFARPPVATCIFRPFSGQMDRTKLYADMIMQRLDEVKSPIFREHLCYENAGHMIMSPLAPVITEAMNLKTAVDQRSET